MVSNWSDSSSDCDHDYHHIGDDVDDWSAYMEKGDGTVRARPQPQPQPPVPQLSSLTGEVERAYWLRRTLRAAIYGYVRYGIVLRHLDPPVQVMLPNSSNWVMVEWEETNKAVAVKEMIWENISSCRAKLSEDPIKEVAAMQYLSTWYGGMVGMGGQAYLRGYDEQNSVTLESLDFCAPWNSIVAGGGPLRGMVTTAGGIENICGSVQGVSPPTMVLYQNPQDAFESNVIMTMDLFSDDRCLYSMVPYCTGGELFGLLEKKKRLSEPEARFWMRQLLRGLSYLKNAGISHRDLSLENILVHEGKIFIVDMGMCLRIPTDDVTGRRCLIQPQGVCGKWHYMSPEVCMNQLPFDGPAVDLWAAGVILFLMLTGFPPWERSVSTDERFKYMSNGYLVQMLTEWQVGLSADAMDLLQRMFWIEPTDRLSLEQVCAHPWMSQALPEYCIMEPGP